MQRLVLTVGLPCSGKSTYLSNTFKFDSSIDNISDKYYDSNYKDFIIVVSADKYKETCKGYDPNHPEIIHEESVKLAESTVYVNIYSHNNVLMDGGGINNNYTLRIIHEARKINPNISIEILYFNTPIKVCLDRLSNRERKVPVDDIYNKNQKLPRCVNNLRNLANKFTTINYFTHKYVFLDMDGTICSYSIPCRDIDGNIDFVNGELFKYLDPVKNVLETVKQICLVDNIFILTACPNSIAWEEKQGWLEEHAPFIKKENIFFVGNKDYKHVFLKHLMLKLKLNKNDVTMIDDNYSIIEKMQSIGVNAIHPSDINSLLNKDF